MSGIIKFVPLPAGTNLITDLASPEQKHDGYLTLISILFSYAYDARTTQCDPTPESAWTICSLTPAFSALDPPPYAQRSNPASSFTVTELHETILPSVRRSLSFPLYRSFALASTCIKDVSVILLNGKKAVLRALLETKKILDHHEVYYVYSKVWVDDFCVWVAREARYVPSIRLIPISVPFPCTFLCFDSATSSL